MVSIGDSAFKGCLSLSKITIHKKVTYIGNNAFQNASNLLTVIIEREVSDITYIGTNVFDGCSSLEEIVVKSNLFFEYMNDTNWSVYDNLIKCNWSIDTCYVNCRSNIEENTKLIAGYNAFYQLDVDCSKSYVINFSSSSPIEFKLYDSQYKLINSDISMSSDEYSGTLQTYLGKGTYYLKVNYKNSDASGDVHLSIYPTWKTSEELVVINDVNYISSHLHVIDGIFKETQLYFVNENEVGFYKFKVEAIKSDGTKVVYPEESIVVMQKNLTEDKKEVISKFNNLSSLGMAKTKADENDMYVYLDRNGYFYVDIKLKNEEYSSVTFYITEVSSNEVDVMGRYNQTFNEEIFSVSKSGDYVERFSTNQPALFELAINANEEALTEMTIIVFGLVYDSSLGSYYINEKYNSSTSLNNRALNLEKGIYYIGYFNKTDSSILTVNLIRLLELQDISTKVLVCDPDLNLPYGTEVRHNGGELGSSTITVGFTRHLHFNNLSGVPSLSRYDYTYLAVDPATGKKSTVVTVSEFGTILAEKVGTAIVTATYIEDNSISFTIEITVISNDGMNDLVIESAQSYSLSSSIDIKDGKYSLVLNEDNSPYPWVQYYSWSISSEYDISVSIDSFGRISASGPGVIILEGDYLINDKVKLIITITINE